MADTKSDVTQARIGSGAPGMLTDRILFCPGFVLYVSEQFRRLIQCCHLQIMKYWWGVMLQFIALQLVYTSGFPLYFYAITYFVGITSPLWYGLLVEERSG